MAIQYSDNEFVKLFRKFSNWEWYKDSATKDIFIHCLIRANWKEGDWKGIHYSRGQFITSIETLSTETGISIQSTKTALSHLKKTGELTCKKIARGLVITVVSYDKFQKERSQVTYKKEHNQLDNSLTDNSELNRNQPQYKNIKNDKEVQEEKEKKNLPPTAHTWDGEWQ